MLPDLSAAFAQKHASSARSGVSPAGLRPQWWRSWARIGVRFNRQPAQRDPGRGCDNHESLGPIQTPVRLAAVVQ